MQICKQTRIQTIISKTYLQNTFPQSICTHAMHIAYCIFSIISFICTVVDKLICTVFVK